MTESEEKALKKNIHFREVEYGKSEVGALEKKRDESRGAPFTSALLTQEKISHRKSVQQGFFPKVREKGKKSQVSEPVG